MAIDFRELVKKGVHFGHQTSRWCPKMAPYIWGSKNKTHLIDVTKTAYQAEKAAQFLESIAAEGKIILWVGTKKPAQDSIKSVSEELGMPGVYHRWIGGIITNFAQIKKSVTNMLHAEDVLANAGKFSNHTKKELNTIQKNVERLNKSVGGLRKLTWPIGAVVLVDVNKERSALLEAAQMGVPVVALVDTNGDPSLVNFVIPANDDAPQSISHLLDYLKEAVQRGMSKAAIDKAAEQRSVEAASENRVIEAGAAVLTLDGEEEEQPAQAQKKPRKVMSAVKNISGARKVKASQSDD